VALLRVAAIGAAATAALTACYQPTLRDCTVSCASASDCAGDQVCGESGWCAAQGVVCALEPDAAGADSAVTDAGDSDATMTDTMVPVDAGASLRIVISGRGSVAGDFPNVDCQSPPGDCTYGISPGTVVTLTAVDGPGGHEFVDWTTPNCMGMGRTCIVTISAPVTLVGVTFD
jgi:hypothetical protein